MSGVFDRLIVSRRGLVAFAVAGLSLPRLALATDRPSIRAYRNPGCGCCEIWVAHMRGAGFEISMEDDADLAGRRKALGVPGELAGCHTAVMGDNIIEGHVPAEDVMRFLDEGVNGLGLAVPGMPVGSPGMEMGTARDAYDVVLFEKSGATSVYKHYPALS